MCIFKMYNLICCFYQSVYISISMKLSPQSDNGHVYHLTSLFMTFYSSSSLFLIFSLPVQPLNCLLSLRIDLHFLEFCVSEITQHILFLFGFFQLVCFSALHSWWRIYQQTNPFRGKVVFCCIDIPWFVCLFTE